MPGPLASIKVLDLGTYAAGPCAAALLGFLGADVIRIENPAGEGLMDIAPLMQGMSASYINANLQKQSIKLDLRSEAGRRVARALLRWADVLVENRLTGVLDRLGLGYEQAARVNPRLVYVSNPGYGSVGPCRQWPALDPYVQALSGFASLQGPAGGRPELFRTYGHLDQFASLSVAQAAVLGLLVRRRTGRGLHVESGQLATTFFEQTTRLAEYLADGQVPPREGSAGAHFAPSQSFRCLDEGYVNLSAPDEATWSRLCAALELEHLRDDGRFATNAARLEHRHSLARLIQARTETAPVWWWLRRLEAHRVPCGPLYDFDAAQRDPHIRDQGLIASVPTAWGSVYHGDHPWRFERTPCGPFEGTHVPGADEAAVLARVADLVAE